MFFRFKDLKKTLSGDAKGFTLLEIIVVIFIVSLGMMGILSLTTQSIRIQYINKNNLIASQLAQEGLELTRNIRDKNWLTLPSEDWDTNLSGGKYKIDLNEIQSATGIDNARLNINLPGFYWHGLGLETNFSRLITISNVTDDSLTVICEVQWKDRSNVYSYVAETVLYNWR